MKHMPKKLFSVSKPWTQCLALHPTTSASEEALSLELGTLSPTTDWDDASSVHSAWLLHWVSAKLCFPVQLGTTKRASCSIQPQAANSCWSALPQKHTLKRRRYYQTRAEIYKSSMWVWEGRNRRKKKRGDKAKTQSLQNYGHWKEKNFPGSILGLQTLHLDFVSFLPLKKISTNWRYLLILFVWV